MRWERVHLHAQPPLAQQVGFGEVSSTGPGKRWGHTCNAIKGGRFLYIFGGYGKDNCQTNQVHVFDTATQGWSQPVIKGTPPTPRDSHSCTTVGDNLYVFGGTDGMNPLNDLHILDTSSNTWISPSVRGDGPEPREGHSAALVGKRLFIFGGCGKSLGSNDEVYYNDLYILNTETFVWKRATTTGTPPSARDSHTCSSWKSKIIIIGGEDGHDYYLSDVHILDADSLTWKELSTSGQMLPPRAGHSTVSFGRNLFVFGGFTDAQNLYDDLYMLDVDAGIWTKVLTTGEGPSARFSVAGDCLDPLRGGVLVFIGGCNKSLEALDDMYFLYTGLASENAQDLQKLEKLSLRKQLKLKCQEQSLTSPIHDKALVRIDQQMPALSYGLPVRRENFPLNQSQVQGKKPFQAKVTESLPYGYTIETIIDGKPLRGILFANKPSTFPSTNYNYSRKRALGETCIMFNGDCNSKSKTSKIVKENTSDHCQAADIHAKEFTSHETEACATPEMRNEASLNASQPDNSISQPNNTILEPNKEPGNQEAFLAPLNLNDDRSDEALDSGHEVSTDLISAIVNLTPNEDERIAGTEQHNDPAKSI